jgi:1-acyl-sn-glycerol-3-phosphate acyltransferase
LLHGTNPANLEKQRTKQTMSNKLSKWIFKLWGWTVTGRYPHEVPKLVLAAAPHTSNWDFPLGLLVRGAVGSGTMYVGKNSLFRWPFGAFFRAIGGVPVERSKRTNFVAAVVEEFRRRDRFHLTIAPEGTRSRVDKFRTGFYHIARLAGVPILLTRFDWQTREVNFGELFYPTGDERADLEYIWDYFKDVRGLNPEKGLGENPYREAKEMKEKG